MYSEVIPWVLEGLNWVLGFCGKQCVFDWLLMSSTLNVPFKIRKAERVFMNVGSLPIRCFFAMVSNASLFLCTRV